MPWQCMVCTLINAEDDQEKCDLCGEPKGATEEGDETPSLGDRDLSGADPERFSHRASRHMSLSSMLRAGPDAYKRELDEKRRLEKLKDVKGVFGVPLTTSAPTLLCDCIAYIEDNGMEVEGVFRIPGQQDMVDALRAEYEIDSSRDILNSFPCDVHDVATLFKTFFRMLPEPLVPMEHYDQLMSAVRTHHEDKEDMIQAVSDVFHSLPSPERECLGLIIQFLKRVASHAQKNMMSPANLATCFAPSLLRAPESATPQQALMDMSACIGALNILIKNPEELPTPPREEIRQNTRYKRKVEVAPPPGMGSSSQSAESDADKELKRKSTKPPPGL